jgi:hypothetical protein
MRILATRKHYSRDFISQLGGVAEELISLICGRDRRLTQYFGVASFTILVYDHIVTFSDEVSVVWCPGRFRVAN